MQKKNLLKKEFRQTKMFSRKHYFCCKSYLGWKYNLHITLEAEIWQLDSTHKNKIQTRWVFGWFSLVDFWFCLVALIFLTHTAILRGNSTFTKPKKLRIGMQVQLTKKDNPKDLGLGWNLLNII